MSHKHNPKITHIAETMKFYYSKCACGLVVCQPLPRTKKEASLIIKQAAINAAEQGYA